MNSQERRFPKRDQQQQREPKLKPLSRTKRNEIKTQNRKSQRSGRGRGGTHGKNN